MNNQLAEIPEGQGADLLNLNMKQIFFLGNEMVKAGMIDGQRAAAQAAVKIMAGQSMGLDPVASMRGIFIIGAGFGFYANLLASRIKSSPKYDYSVIALTEEACAIEFFEYIAGKRVSLGTERFTRADAKRQGTKNIDKFPRNMLFARTLSNGAKFYTPDVMNGLPIQTEGDIGSLQVIDEPPVEPTPEEQAAENERAKAAINRGKKTKPKEEPKPTDVEAAETAEAPEPAKDATPPSEAVQTAPSEPTSVADDMDEDDNMKHRADGKPAQVDGDPTTYLNPIEPPAPAKPAADEGFLDADESEFQPHTEPQRKRVMALLNDLTFKSDAEKRKIVAGVLGLESLTSFKEISFDDASKLIESLQQSLDSEGGAEGLRMFFITKDDGEEGTPANAAA